MDPVTHALASATLARAGLDKTTRLALPMLLVSGVAADLDLLSYFGGAGAYLRCHRTLLHSILGSAILVLILAAIFWLAGRRHLRHPLQFRRVVVVCATGAALHLLLDLCNSSGLELLWPFHPHWYAWDLLAGLDPWILILLVAGLFLPALLRLVGEEIGGRRRAEPPRWGAIAALILVAGYIGARAELHRTALAMLLSRDYHDAPPILAAAFPSPTSPFDWRGVVDTANTIEQIRLPLGPGAYFDPERSLTQFKPEASPALDAARRTATARRFILYARFPIATVEKTEAGYRVTLRDLRFPADSSTRNNLFAAIDLNSQLQPIRQEFLFPGASQR